MGGKSHRTEEKRGLKRFHQKTSIERERTRMEKEGRGEREFFIPLKEISECNFLTATITQTQGKK